MVTQSRKFARRLLPIACTALLSATHAQTPLPAGRLPSPWQHSAWTTAQGLPQNSIHALAQTPDGFLWIATESGLARFDGAQFRLYTGVDLGPTASEDLCCLAVAAHGTLWVGSSLGLAALRDSHILPLPSQPPFTGSRIRSLHADADSLLVATDDGTFRVRMDVATPIATPVLPPSEAAAAPPPELHEPDGSLWIGTPRGLTWQPPHATTAAPVPWLLHEVILSLLRDDEGDLWVGTESSGLHRLRSSPFSTWPSTAGLAVTAVTPFDNGSVLLASRDGDLVQIDPAGTKQRLAHFNAAITALQRDGHSTWVATTDGLFRFDPHGAPRRFTSADGLPDDYIRSLALAPDGSAWIGTPHGLAHISHDHITPLNSDLIGVMLWTPSLGPQPDGLWLATEHGLSHISAAGTTIFTLRDHTTDAVPAALAYDPTGSLWAVDQDGGLWTLRGTTFVKRLQLPTGRPRQQPQSMLIDTRGTLWILLRDGLLSASTQRLATCTPATCTSLADMFTTWQIGDGLPSTESIAPGFAPPGQSGNDLLFATRGGLAVAQLALAAEPHRLHADVEDVLLDDHAIDRASLQHLPYARQRLTFEYAAASLAQPTHVRYRVRLRGFDNDWVDMASRRSATYTALPAGPYTFLVQAALEGQPWPADAASLALHIDPPFYQRWWFRILALVLFAILVFALYRLRLRAEHHRFALVTEERNRLAREVHDTLAQDLVSTGIQLDVALFALKHEHTQQATDLLRTLRRRVAQALTEARESVGELRDPDLRLDLASRLHRLAERRSTPNVTIDVRTEGPPRPLPPGVERELLRIAGEALANAIKHASPTHITLAAVTTLEALTLTIHDNGCGFDPSAPLSDHDHYGLRGVHERAEAIGATLTLISQPGAGTTVSVMMPNAR